MFVEILRAVFKEWRAKHPGQLYDPRGMRQARPPRRCRRGKS